jgi:hypothetical protein
MQHCILQRLVLFDDGALGAETSRMLSIDSSVVCANRVYVLV